MGYGIIADRNGNVELLAMGVLKLNKYSDHPMKLRKIFERTLSLIDEFLPDELAIEAPFYGKNVQSMLKLGRAQGVAMAAALYRDMPIFDYSPTQIKRSITGNGSASKEQVAAMLKNIVQMSKPPDYLDATDGLAAAVCHYFKKGKPSEKGSYTGWKNFISKNPDRIR